MRSWRPLFFPELNFPVHNTGTDASVLKRVTLRVLNISNLSPRKEPSQPDVETRRDMGWAIVIDSDKPNADYPTELSVEISPDETLDVLVTVGAKRSLRARCTLLFEYDSRSRTQSQEFTVDIVNDGGFEHWYRYGLPLEMLRMPKIRRTSDLQANTREEPVEITKRLYRENRPMNIDLLRGEGPGKAYFFRTGEEPTLPIPRDPPLKLEHSTSPLFYVVVVPAYEIMKLSDADAAALSCDPRLAPPTARDSVPTFHGLNKFGACSAADVPEGFAATQVLPYGGIWGINTEIFSGASAARWVGAIHRRDMELIPWGVVHSLAVNTVNRYLETMKEILGVHGPVYIRAGLVNVRGLSLAEIPEGYKDIVFARGPLRQEKYLDVEFMEHTDPYQTGTHILSAWSISIANDASAGRYPKILSLDGEDS